MDVHILKDIDILTLIPEYDEDYDKNRYLSSLVIVPEVGKRLRITPMLNLSTEIPYLEVEEDKEG